MANYSCECVECESHFPEMTFGECGRMWANVGESGESIKAFWRIWQIFKLGHFMYKKKIFLGIKQSSLPSPNSPNSPNSLNSLNTCQIRRRESQKFGGSLVFANSSTRQKRQIFGEYSNSLNLPASGHCLSQTHLEGVSSSLTSEWI